MVIVLVLPCTLIWLLPHCTGPTNAPNNQQFQKNFPSLEEREARGTKRSINNEQHDNAPAPFNEMDNMSSESLKVVVM